MMVKLGRISLKRCLPPSPPPQTHPPSSSPSNAYRFGSSNIIKQRAFLLMPSAVDRWISRLGDGSPSPT